MCHLTPVALEQLPCFSPQWCCWAASHQSTLLTAASDLFSELMVEREVKGLYCVALFCVFAGEWDSQGHDANWQSSPQGNDGNAGTWGQALVVFVRSAGGLDLVRDAFLKSEREFGWRGRVRLCRFSFLRFASFTECRWVSTVSFFSRCFLRPREVAFLLPWDPGASSPFVWLVVVVRNLNWYFSEEVISGHSW